MELLFGQADALVLLTFNAFTDMITSMTRPAESIAEKSFLQALFFLHCAEVVRIVETPSVPNTRDSVVGHLIGDSGRILRGIWRLPGRIYLRLNIPHYKCGHQGANVYGFLGLNQTEQPPFQMVMVGGVW